jgi:cytochrome b561
MMRNSTTEYGTFSKVMHWMMATIIIILIAVGIYMTDLPRDTDEQKQFVFQIYGMHKTFGVIALLLIAVRLVWLKVSPNPPLPAVFEGKERMLIEGLKKLLYLMMVLMPLSGYLMSNAGGHPIKFFGLFELPALIGENKAFGGIVHEMHEIGGWIMLFVILLHVAGAVKHWLKEKGSERDILQRML